MLIVYPRVYNATQGGGVTDCDAENDVKTSLYQLGGQACDLLPKEDIQGGRFADFDAEACLN